jgi:hypothetical protein
MNKTAASRFAFTDLSLSASAHHGSRIALS